MSKMEEPKDFGLLDDEEENSVQSDRVKTSVQSKTSKFNISPNRPNTNKIDLKSIDRPRSHSPMKLNGIENYIQQYEKRKSTENLATSHIPNKITMNLKMDDLLANKNESNSYQMLSDFSVLTGDIDEFTSKNRNRRLSLDQADDDDDEDDEDKKNLNYKFTAVYKKDETGEFKEKSKTVFENKKLGPQPARPPPPESIPSLAKPQIEVVYEPSSVKSQLELALEALKNNSDKLDKKIEKIDDMRPSANEYEDSSVEPPSPGDLPSTEVPVIKKKNEDFFNDILTKSDDLIAQTQTKLERLSKLETITKPLAPLANPTPPPPKPRPMASLITPETSSINNSKSLIDLKSSQSQVNLSGTATSQNETNQIDFLFDLSTEFIPASEPIKQGGSYVDLLGLECDIENVETIQNVNNFCSDLMELSLDAKVEQQVDIVPAVDIHITEPLNEINDNNIVPEDYFNLKHEIPKDQYSPNHSRSPSPIIVSTPKFETKIEPTPPPAPTPQPPKKEIKENKVKKTVWTQGNSQGESSSESSEEDETQKFQVRIRPKASKNLNEEIPKSFIPLLPKPPKSVEEIEELRLRRRSSDAGSITRSIKESSSSDDEQVTKIEVAKSELRKTSVQSEFNLELPDDDDSLPLTDFNEKYELLQYTDGNYGCIVLVRQPFRNANVMYKNAIQKVTEVRTWTECLVKLVDSETGGKKLVFYNAHELMTLAAEKDTTIDKIIDAYVVNSIETKTEESSEPKIQPFHEIELKTSYKFTDMCLQQFDNFQKIHTFKIQDIIFKETLQMRPDRLMALPERFLKKFTKAKVTSLIDHTPLPFEICKFGHLSYSYLRSFLLLLQDAFWSLPTLTRKKQREDQLNQIQQQPVTPTMSLTAVASSIFSLGTNKQIQAPSLNSVVSNHAREEITVKVVDEYRAKLDKECRIKEHKSRTRVYLTAFLNEADPAIEIGLNDVLRHGKEIVGRYDIIPIKTEQWISPELFELNEKVVNKEEFEKTHCLRCVQMPDNLLVEIMRFRTRPRRNYELPLQVRSYMSVVNRQVEIRIECTVAGSYYTNISDVFCEDIQIRFPLPDAWVYLFRVEKMFRYGAVHSTKTKLGKIKGLERLLLHKTSHQAAIMEASCGMAKYEQAFKSLVWRIEQLPVKNKDIYKTQLFVCRLNLQEYDQFPDKYDEIAQVQYSIPICASSKCQVRSVSVSPCDEPPEKWAKLKSKFEYDLEINYSFDQSELPKVDPEKCAELQHLPSQTESEGDNNEDDD